MRLHRRLIEEINLSALEKLPEDEIRRHVQRLVSQYVLVERLALNSEELSEFVSEILDEMTGLGPLEPLLKDPSISDILINGHECVYVERGGMLEPLAVRFKDEQHLLRIINKIVSAVGRRVDESHPLCDARLQDGSRVNVAVRPIGVDGPLVSIRKFSKKPLNLSKLVEVGALRPPMAEVLAAAVKARISTIISGGTGSGKTTMLNALSAFISEKERLITIEDAAELQLQQPHVGRMETRPPNIEGKGEIRQRDLVKNALRMRPDRIILGECRGEEAFDMLQAMNTGHEGSMATIHANTPRDAITRLEQMIGMAGLPMTVASIRGQIANAVQLIVQLTRQSDGKRKVTSIAEITGLEGDIIQMQEIYKYVRTGTAADGTVQGHFQATGVRPRFLAHLDHARHQDPRQLLRSLAAAVNRHDGFQPDLPVLPADRRLRGDAGGGRLSAALQQRLLSQEHQPPPQGDGRQAGPRKRAGAVAPRARADVMRRVPAAAHQPQSTGPAIRPVDRLQPPDGVHRRRHGAGVCRHHDVRRQDVARARRRAVCRRRAAVHGVAFPASAAGRRSSAPNFPTPSTSSCARLRAGHPVPVAINMVAREMADPIGSEFGIVTDEITYGADLETAMRNLYFRVGSDDLPLFVTAVAIQGSTGGNLGEILENLSAVIRQRFKMRRKIRALAAEGRASALILSSLPIGMFAVINFVTPDFYASVWDESLTKTGLALAGCWMGIGNFVMYRLVNFRI